VHARFVRKDAFFVRNLPFWQFRHNYFEWGTPLAKISVIEATLRVELGPLEAYRAKRASFSVELWRVKDVMTVAAVQRNSIGTQLLGRSAYAGLFANRGSRTFVYWQHKTDAVKITVVDPAFDHILIGSQDADKIAKELQAAVKAAKKS
jgi:hypothetical protein